MSYLYVIRMPGHPFVKIGKASDPESRLNALQIGNPYPLELAAKILVDRKILASVEAQVHSILEDKWSRGEWFQATVEEVLPAIAEAISLAKSTTSVAVAGPIQDEIIPVDPELDALEVPAEGMDAKTFFRSFPREHVETVCRQAGTSLGYFQQFWVSTEQGGRKPSLDLAKRLAQASGGLMTVRKLRPDLAALVGAAA